MNLSEVRKLDVGDEVIWTDPDAGIGSGTYFVTEIITESGMISDMDDVLVVRNDAGSTTEVYASELQ